MATDTEVSELRLVVTVEDHDVALAFYRDALGLAEVDSYAANGGHVTILDAGRATLEINDPAYADYIDDVEVGRRVGGRIRIAFGVEDSATRTERLTAAGAKLVAPPTRTPWGSLNSRLEDPEGRQLTLFTDA